MVFPLPIRIFFLFIPEFLHSESEVKNTGKQDEKRIFFPIVTET